MHALKGSPHPFDPPETERSETIKARRWFLLSLTVLTSWFWLPSHVWACACCANNGHYHIGFTKPSAYELSHMNRLRFAPTAHLFLTEAGVNGDAKGLAHPAEAYSLSGLLAGNVWKLTFRDGNKSGTLNLPLPARMLRYQVDIHDGQMSGGGGPSLYKEWRFEGQVKGTGLFQAGLTAPAKYFLVLQGRGNACDTAEDFTHWRVAITGERAKYAFYGELAKPAPDSQPQ